MRQLLTSIALIATFAATGQEYVIDTLFTENIGCNGESFKLLYSDNSADMDALIQNYLDERGFLGATIIEVASVDMMSTNCWCLGGNPDSPECNDIGVCCDCCGGQAIRSFVDFIVLGYPNTPCSELPFDQQQIQCSGCTDDEALNYNHIASIEDNSCIYTHTLCQDGTVWNEELGGCIVENPTDTDLDGCTGVDDVLDVLATFGMCYTEEPVEAWECGDTLEYWGYWYETVQIDGQCLFALVGQVEELVYQNDILTDSLAVAHDSIQDLTESVDSLLSSCGQGLGITGFTGNGTHVIPSDVVVVYLTVYDGGNMQLHLPVDVSIGHTIHFLMDRGGNATCCASGNACPNPNLYAVTDGSWQLVGSFSSCTDYVGLISGSRATYTDNGWEIN